MSGRGSRRWARVLPALAAGLVWALHDPRASQPPDLPRVLERVVPVVPDSLAALGLSGWVVVHVRIDSAGRVSEARAMDHVAGGYFFGHHAQTFEAAAVAAARGHRFGPGAGQTSPAGTFAVPITFRARPDSSAQPTGTLVGEVYDVDHRWRLSKVGICAPDARLATLTQASGEFRLEGVPAGTHEIVVSARDYCSLRRTVVIRPGVTDTLDLALRPCHGGTLRRCFGIPRRASR